jgi:AcrR family transcriptional regulator
MTAPPASSGVDAAPARPLRADALRNRARILDAARSVFRTDGVDASLEEIARTAGVGIGTLYRHFPNRNALLDAMFRDSVDELCAQADEIGASDDPADAFVGWLRAQLRHAMTYQSLAASLMISELGDESPVNACGEQTACAALRATAETQLARAQAAGVVRGDLEADDLMRMVNAIAIASADASDDCAAAERLFGLMVDGLRR